MPKFEYGISVANLDALAEVMKKLDYHGPVALACDDCKLDKGLHGFPTGDGIWRVIGNAGEPLDVAEEDLEALLSDPNVVKAEKVRNWTESSFAFVIDSVSIASFMGHNYPPARGSAHDCSCGCPGCRR